MRFDASPQGNPSAKVAEAENGVIVGSSGASGGLWVQAIEWSVEESEATVLFRAGIDVQNQFGAAFVRSNKDKGFCTLGRVLKFFKYLLH